MPQYLLSTSYTPPPSSPRLRCPLLETRVEQGCLDTVGQQVHAVELPLRVDGRGPTVCDIERVCVRGYAKARYNRCQHNRSPANQSVQYSITAAQADILYAFETLGARNLFLFRN